MISLYANFSIAKNNSVKKGKEGENTMKAQRLMSRVRENTGLLELLLDLAFLFFGLLKQVNIAVEGKRCDFRTFFRFSDFIFRLAKNSEAKIFIVAFT